MVKPKRALDPVAAAAAKVKKDNMRKKIMRKCSVLVPIALFVQRVVDWLGSKFWFPWYFQAAPFAMCWIYAGVGSFILVIYGIKFDADYKSPQWLASSGTDVVKDIFVNGPAEFVVKAVLFVALIRLFEFVFFPKQEIVEQVHAVAEAAKEVKEEKELEDASGDKNETTAVVFVVANPPAPQPADFNLDFSRIQNAED
jgi:hypothetical protein